MRSESRARVYNETIVQKIEREFGQRANFIAIRDTKSQAPNGIILRAASDPDLFGIAETLQMNFDQLPQMRAVSRWMEPKISDLRNKKRKPTVFADCPYRLSPTTKRVIEVIPPNWRSLISQGLVRQLLPITQDLEFFQDKRGWSAHLAETGQLVRPSIFRNARLEPTAVKHVYSPGEIVLVPLLHRTFFVAMPATAAEEDITAVELYADEEDAHDFSYTIGARMWDLTVDPFNFFPAPNLRALIVDAGSAKTNLQAAVNRIVQDCISGGEALFDLARRQVMENARGRNPDIPDELVGPAQELETEFLQAYAASREYVMGWADWVTGKLAEYSAIGLPLDADLLGKLMPQRFGDESMSTPLADWTPEQFFALYHRALVHRAAALGWKFDENTDAPKRQPRRGTRVTPVPKPPERTVDETVNARMEAKIKDLKAKGDYAEAERYERLLADARKTTPVDAPAEDSKPQRGERSFRRVHCAFCGKSHNMPPGFEGTVVPEVKCPKNPANPDRKKKEA